MILEPSLSIESIKTVWKIISNCILKVVLILVVKANQSPTVAAITKNQPRENHRDH